MSSRPGRIHSEAGKIRDSVGLRRAACDSRRQRRYLKVRSLIFMSSHTHFLSSFAAALDCDFICIMNEKTKFCRLHNWLRFSHFISTAAAFTARHSAEGPRQQNVGSPRRVQLSESREITTDPDVKASVANYAIYDYSVLPRLKITLNQPRSHCHCFTRQSWSH